MMLVGHGAMPASTSTGLLAAGRWCRLGAVRPISDQERSRTWRLQARRAACEAPCATDADTAAPTFGNDGA
jgi:hypothetical protein